MARLMLSSRNCARIFFLISFAAGKGRLALIVDESRTLQSANSIHPGLDRVVGQHPIHDVLIIQTTHEIKEWNSKSKIRHDEVLLFHQKGRRITNVSKIYAEQTLPK